MAPEPIPGPGQNRHPHLHIALWSGGPLRLPHRLTRDELHQVCRAVVQAICGPERILLAQQWTVLRAALRHAGARTLADALAVARSLRGRLRLAPAPMVELGGRRRVAGLPQPGGGGWGG